MASGHVIDLAFLDDIDSLPIDRRRAAGFSSSSVPTAVESKYSCLCCFPQFKQKRGEKPNVRCIWRVTCLWAVFLAAPPPPPPRCWHIHPPPPPVCSSADLYLRVTAFLSVKVDLLVKKERKKRRKRETKILRRSKSKRKNGVVDLLEGSSCITKT